jgi:ABC-type transporter Mla MlaB component
MIIQLEEAQLTVGNIPKLIKNIHIADAETIDCANINNITSAGLASLVYIKTKSTKSVKFTNLSQALQDLCSVYSISL